MSKSTGARRAKTPRRGRRRLDEGPAFDRERLIEALLAITRDHGLEAVQMRTVAKELSLSPRLLYRHVKDKEGMIDLLVDTILARSMPDLSVAGWDHKLRSIARSMRQAYAPYPGVLAASVSRGANILGQPHAAAIRTAVMDALSEAGLNARATYQGYIHFSVILMGSMLLLEQLRSSSSPMDDPAVIEASLDVSLEKFLQEVAATAGNANRAKAGKREGSRARLRDVTPQS
jgi:TetR/AcrR family transcriptional regulator, tetracycline repressor protein